MTLYNVHTYRQMRLVFLGVEAGTAEAAAAIARDKPTGDADEIDDCDGETFAALVDVVGDEYFGQSETIDFEPERQRQAAPKLLAALEAAEGFVHWALDHGACQQATTAALEFIRAAIAEAKSTGIASESGSPTLLSALNAVLPYAENERDSLRECWKRDGDPTVKEELEACDRALGQANAAIAPAKAARIPPATLAASEIYDTLSYVAETLSGFKPDLLRNLGLDIALDKALAALRAAESVKAQVGRHE